MMTKLSTRITALFILLLFLIGDVAFIAALAGAKVKGYYRKDGTYRSSSYSIVEGSSSYTPLPGLHTCQTIAEDEGPLPERCSSPRPVANITVQAVGTSLQEFHSDFT